MKKTNKDNKLVYAGGIGLVIVFALFIVSSYTATAGVSFWGGIQELIAGKTVDKIFSEAPDFSVDNLMLTGTSPDHYIHNTFKENISIGGQSYATSSTAATYTLTRTEIPSDRSNSLLVWTPNINTTLTTMATSSYPLAGLDVGESFTMYLYNASTTADSTITLAAGAGVDLQEDEGETVIVNGLEIARLTFLRVANKDALTDVVLWVEVGQVAD